MMTGMELTFRPTEAMMIATARIHAFGPLKSILLLIERSAASVSIYVSIFATSRIMSVSFLKIFIIKAYFSGKYRIKKRRAISEGVFRGA